MHYYDDILNVCAYLRSKQKETMLSSSELIQSIIRFDEELETLSRKMDADLQALYEVAEREGIDVSDIKSKYERPTKTPEKPSEEQSFIESKIPLTKDFDAHASFMKLCEEAHAAGFTDVHPEELVSEEEFELICEVDRQLDLQFEKETELKGKDILILAVSAAIRVICFFAVRFINEHNKQLSELTENDPKSGFVTENTSAEDGIDFDSLIKSAKTAYQATDKGAKVLKSISGTMPSSIRTIDSILMNPEPFDLDDNVFFKRSDLAGYNKYLGWIIGVLNIITNTATTFKLKSYSVSGNNSSDVKRIVEDEVSTINKVILPVFKNIKSNKRHLVAAVVKEAEALKFTSSADKATEIFDRAIKIDKRNEAFHSGFAPVIERINKQFASVLGGAATNSFVNLIISAIHSVVYNPETDGGVDKYIVRTNKIIAYSSGISAMINNMPALLSENIEDVDFASMLNFLVTEFESLRYSIEVKTNFLVSEHKKVIDSQLRALDKYFEQV